MKYKGNSENEKLFRIMLENDPELVIAFLNAAIEGASKDKLLKACDAYKKTLANRKELTDDVYRAINTHQQNN